MRFTVLPILFPAPVDLHDAIGAAFVDTGLASLSMPWLDRDAATGHPVGLPVEMRVALGARLPVSEVTPPAVMTALALIAGGQGPCATPGDTLRSFLSMSYFVAEAPQQSCLVGQVFGPKLGSFRLTVGAALIGLMPKTLIGLPLLSHLLADLPDLGPWRTDAIRTAVADWPEPVRAAARILPLLLTRGATCESAHEAIATRRRILRDISAFTAPHALLDPSLADPLLLETSR